MRGRPTLVLAALLAPLAATLAVVPFRDDLANTNAALLLVIVVVAVAARGDRIAGAVAALSAGLWFDVFLTRPYNQPTIDARADIETTVLLLVVGLAVTELAVWGRRQQARASRAEGYTAGIREAVGSITDGLAPGAVIEQVTRRLPHLLQATDCRFDYGTGRLGGRHPRLRPDGQVEIAGTVHDVERDGLPADADVEILLTSAGEYLGRFVIATGPNAHPSLAQRLAAVTLTDRAATALAESRSAHPV